MSRITKKLLVSSAFLCLLLTVSGCVPALQNNTAELERRAREIKSVRMLSPEIKIYELSAGDVSELRDDWSAQGQKNAEKAISEAMKDRGVRVSLLRPDSRTEGECEDVMALYKAVIDSVYTHTLMGSPNLFPDKVKNFDYTVGSLEKVLDRQKNAGMLIVYGSDEISTRGRKALRVVQAVNPFAPPQLSGVTYVQMALVDRSGDILWWRSFANSGGYDLRDYESASDFIRKILDDYPGGRQ